ncbi:hypothetical protein KAH55_13025, partial [bacterium]|nr:hypothetical protein [bacterium]
MRRYINALKNRPTHRRDRLFREFIFVILLAYFTALTIAAVQIFNVRDRNSQDQIVRIAENVQYNYQQLVQNTERFLHICRRWGATGDLDWNFPEILDERLIPFLDEISYIGSMMLSERDGVHYVLHQQHEQWASCTDLIDADLEACAPVNWAFKVGPAIRYYPWFSGIINSTDSAAVYWAAPDSLFFSPNIGITGSTRWFNPRTRQVCVASFGLKFENMYQALENGAGSPNTRLLVFTRTGRFYSLIDSMTVPKRDDALREVLRQHFSQLLGGDGFTEPFSFRIGTERWWSRFVPLSLNQQPVWMVVTTPENDFYQHFRERQRSLLLVLGLVFIFGPLLLIV